MKADVNNIILNYIIEGNGNPLILLHGNGEDHHIFDKLIEKLKENFTVYAIDSRNHGDSTKTQDYSYETMAKDIYQFIKKLGLKEVSVVGFSDGAIISLLLSIKYQNIFKKMALLGVNLKPEDFKKNIYSYLQYEYEKNNDPLVKMMLEQPQIDLNELKVISTPTLVIAAQNDLFYRKSFLNIVKTMTNATLKVIPKHDHGSYIINNDLLYSDLKDFLL
ncbi:alpha/beta fold hydrolase [Dysgonomonas sp. Marseille-P4677]|uniref:alpha/beta fold hydrolase n=1 Tax=Dysgonomonas sp. Marseille-P4677 TaxID=2364790 RepID=UPI00191430D2|nr:alpha/beta fold hydrolase [Dysgonomonas sp. Marseille-P4677]MBK5722564.1 alpha/beta fold hydrolase [Dysgonomonas sp. Marseille-P4677]